ncbi:response regulator [Lederbergia wuyishanensis]|uniref:Two-component system chemotaxis response regulator CheY n=1 Tax=Lederbergia wuyishanensis TaxID=1347903 RepID=A0ABU0D7L8_9BACI|nr:response regulator [Lederbergia wuyishanensis]MCJ8009033.1 response regulator [Lederbergia wuyishanensis]MDQ0344367.1 two-component system chemotaxis response regulator CheY [Lederbergia wuyishanensis]
MTKILLVDDSVFMRSWLKKLLSDANFNDFVEAEDGLHAIEMYKSFFPDIVIMDNTMPKLDGIGALKEIMKMDPNAKVIICTALGMESLVIEAIECGAKDFVIKPFFDNLIDRINNVLSTR